MNITLRLRSAPVLKLRYVPGLKGEKGDTGDVTPEAIAARDAAIAARTGAETAQTAAGSSAAAAAGSASSASGSASAASGSASAAATSETNAGNSASAAAGSASSASGSATTATTQAGTATTQAGNAATSATDAGNSASAAATSESNAADSAADALASALDAAASAGTATGFQIPQGRLTLTSGVAVTTSDVVGATTIYYTPAVGNRVPLWNGTILTSRTLTELSLPLDSNSGHTGYHQAGNLFDLFVFDRSGALTLGTGPKWTTTLPAGSSARGTGAGTTEIELFNGIRVNANTITLRYGTNTGDTVSVPARQATLVGSAIMSADGQTTDAKGVRYLSNAYNRVEKLIYRNTGTASWTNNSATPRIAGGDTNNLIPFVVCLPGDPVKVQAAARFSSSGPTVRVGQTGIGLNQYATFNDTLRRTISVGSDGTSPTVPAFGHPTADTILYPPAGFNFVAWMEGAEGADTQTFYGVENLTGISGTIWA